MPEVDASDREITLVTESGRTGAFTLRVGGTDQSHVDLEDATRLEFDYIQRMADVLEARFSEGEPIRVVHIGGAGMTLARYVAATRPRSAQVVLEPHEALTAFVREHLPLPARSGIKVRPIDGRAGIAAIRDDFSDVVVLDAFDGARIPAELTTGEFLSDVARVLVNGGVLLANVTDHAPFPYVRNVVAGVSEHFGHLAASAEPATLKGRRFGNVLLVASDTSLQDEAIRRQAARSPFPYRVLDDGDVRKQLAGGSPYTAENSSRSPEPPGGKAFFS
ncbi:fused MFS/spermidine synthase [soil metagenome]